MRKLWIVSGGAIVFLTVAGVAADSFGQLDLKRSESRVGIFYYPHGPQPEPGQVLLCRLWFPPPEVSSLVVRTEEAAPARIGAYGMLIESTESRAGCPPDAWVRPSGLAFLSAAAGMTALTLLGHARKKRKPSPQRAA
jgi:hypothetical protein